MEEDRYENISVTIKQRLDGESWFDVIFDLIAGDCEGGGGECILAETICAAGNFPHVCKGGPEGCLIEDESDCENHEHEEILPCTCGLEIMGGSSGTLEQCFKAGTSVGRGLQPIDLARAIVWLEEANYEHVEPENVKKAIKWAKDEVDFEENWGQEL